MTDGIVTLAAATIAGLSASGHCVAMCGGMAGALGLRAARVSNDRLTRTAMAATYQAGRIGGYALAGALCGALGAGLHLLIDAEPLVTALRVASGILILLVAARVALRWNPLSWLERAGGKLWSIVRPLALRKASGNSPPHALMLGFVWGWLPCGLVYSMLLFAAMSGSALQGSAIMLAYGLGTLPSMLGAMIFAAGLQRWLARPAGRAVTALLLVCFGTWTLFAATLPIHEIGGLHSPGAH